MLNNRTISKRMRQPPDNSPNVDACGLGGAAGCDDGCSGGFKGGCDGKRLVAGIPFRGRLVGSYATGATRVPSMSVSLTRRGSGILSLSSEMWGGGVGVRFGKLAFVVSF